MGLIHSAGGGDRVECFIMRIMCNTQSRYMPTYICRMVSPEASALNTKNRYVVIFSSVTADDLFNCCI